MGSFSITLQDTDQQHARNIFNDITQPNMNLIMPTVNLTDPNNKKYINSMMQHYNPKLVY